MVFTTKEKIHKKWKVDPIHSQNNGPEDSIHLLVYDAK
jgi:hypothetical protein